MKAGQAARKSSLSQPGKDVKLAGTICIAAGLGAGAGTGKGAGWTGGAGCGSVGLAGAAGGSDVVVQAASASMTTAAAGTSRLRRINDIRIAMWVLMIEALVAFFLLVFIVWWTMYQGKKPAQKHRALPKQEHKHEPDRRKGKADDAAE
jgi:hypothetical protein